MSNRKKLKKTHGSFFKNIFIANSGVSSKRICGFTGFFVCVIILIIATFIQYPIPEFADTLLITSATLLGVDSVTKIWSRK